MKLPQAITWLATLALTVATAAAGCSYVTGLNLLEGSSTVLIDSAFRGSHVVVSQNGQVLCEGQSSSANGHFPCDLGVVDGDVDICIEGGRYDNAAGDREPVESNPDVPLCTRLPVKFLEAHTVVFTPWTPLVSATARAWLQGNAPAEVLETLQGAGGAVEAASGPEAEAKAGELDAAKAAFPNYEAAHNAAEKAWNAFLGGCAVEDGAAPDNVVNTQPLWPAQWNLETVGFTTQRVAGALASGLSELVAAHNTAMGNGIGATTLTTPRLLRGLAKDLNDGRLNGVDERGERGSTPILADGLVLSSHTLRFDLTQAIHRVFEQRAQEGGAGPEAWRPNEAWLACLSEATGPLFDEAGKTLDISGPEVEFVAPAALDENLFGGPVPVSGRFQLLVRATDPSGVQEIKVDGTGLSDTGESTIQDQDLRIEANKQEAVYTAWLESGLMVEGRHTLRAIAQDALGHQTEGQLQLSVNNKGPSIALREPDAAKPVSGIVTLVAQALDEHGVQELVITQPAGFVDQDARPDFIVGDWDTTQEVDGLFKVVFSATDMHGNTSAPHQVELKLNNYEGALIGGRVSLAEPVLGARVQALAVDASGAQTRVLDDVATDGSRYTLELPDDYRGYVVLRAYGTTSGVQGEGARVQDLIYDRELKFGADDELLSYFNYTPERIHRTYESHHINAITTLATAYARPDFAKRGDAAWELFKEHAWLVTELQKTPVRQLSIPSDEDVTAPSTYLALMHVGLSRMAAERSAAHEQHITTLELLQKLKRDIGDAKDIDAAKFDGVDSVSRRIGWAAGKSDWLDANTLRVELAHAIAHWLEDRDVGIRKQTPQLLGVGSRQYEGEGGFLDNMSTNTSVLFGTNAAPRPFDLEGPEINIHAPLQPQDQGTIFTRDTLEYSFDVKDRSGLDRILVSLGGQTLLSFDHPPENQPTAMAKTGIFNFTATPISQDSITIEDGFWELKLEAWDPHELHSLVVLPIAVDRTPPELTMDHEPVKKRSGWISAADDGIATVRIKHRDLIATKRLSFTHNSKAIEPIGTLPGDDHVFRFRVGCHSETWLKGLAEDAAGNTTSAAVKLQCDDIAPSITAVTPQNFTSGGWLNAADQGVASLKVEATDANKYSIAFDTGDETVSPPADANDKDVYKLTVGCPAEGKITTIVTDEAGNETRKSIPIKCDNVLPEVNAKLKPVRGGTWLTAADNGVAKVEVGKRDLNGTEDPHFWRDDEAVAHTKDSTNTELYHVEVGCSATSQELDVVVQDVAGNESRKTLTVQCDNQGPGIIPQDSIFRQESISPTHDYRGYQYGGHNVNLKDAWGATWTLSKAFNRLDQSSENIPTLVFRVDEETPGTVGYRYYGPKTKGVPSLNVVEPDANGIYEIPISYQSLSSDIALAKPHEAHRIALETTDSHGNKANHNFKFKLKVLIPPLLVSGCEREAHLNKQPGESKYPMARFVNAATTDVATWDLTWPVEFAHNTAAPTNPLKVVGSNTPYTITSLAFVATYTVLNGPHTYGAEQGPCYGKKAVALDSTVRSFLYQYDNKCYQSPSLFGVAGVPRESLDVHVTIQNVNEPTVVVSELQPKASYQAKVTTGTRAYPSPTTSEIPVVTDAPNQVYWNTEMHWQTHQYYIISSRPTFQASHALGAVETVQRGDCTPPSTARP